MAWLLPPLHTSDAIVCALFALQSPVRWKTMQPLRVLGNQSSEKNENLIFLLQLKLEGALAIKSSDRTAQYTSNVHWEAGELDDYVTFVLQQTFQVMHNEEQEL